jgi:hypothetical protein
VHPSIDRPQTAEARPSLAALGTRHADCDAHDVVYPEAFILFDASTSSRRTRIARGRRRKPAWLAIPVLLPVTGCGVAPSVNILGSFFPAWLFCIVVGIVLTIATLRVLGALEIADLGPPALVYPCLAGLWAFAAWLVVFGS